MTNGKGRGRPTTKGSLNKDYHTYTPEQTEFIIAVSKWKIEHQVHHPPLHALFDIMIKLGYRKVK